MFKVRAIDYQPGTGTRYLLVIGKVTSKKDARELCCRVGDIFIAWEGMGAFTFHAGVRAGYLKQKLKLNYEYDAEALVQLIWNELSIDTTRDWPVCDKCGLPYHNKGLSEKCYCQKE